VDAVFPVVVIMVLLIMLAAVAMALGLLVRDDW